MGPGRWPRYNQSPRAFCHIQNCVDAQRSQQSHRRGTVHSLSLHIPLSRETDEDRASVRLRPKWQDSFDDRGIRARKG